MAWRHGGHSRAPPSARDAATIGFVSEAPTEAFGPYLVYEQLGAGGMAQVHRAEVIGDGFHRPVALKRMLPHVAGNLDMVKAFVREAHLASQLRHTNVAQTYELGKVDDTYFIAMELIRGRNLREILRQCGATTGHPMPVPVALNVLNQICDALDYAHNACDESGQPLGIIHRDVSPSNIIVSEGGTVKLIDFGIAKVSAAGMQTMSGTLKGKFGYMAPEYIEGSIDARADLFAVGVIAHELLTNRPLFSTQDDMETLRRVREMTVSPPSARNPKVPREIDDIVMTALARDPDRRWQHATALRTAMTTVTARHDLVMTNSKAWEWLDWLFEQTDPRGVAPAPASSEPADEPSEPEIRLEGSGHITSSSSAAEPPTNVLPLGIRASPADINQTIAGTVPARRAPPRTIDPPNRPSTEIGPGSGSQDPPNRPPQPRPHDEPAFVGRTALPPPGSGTRAPTQAAAKHASSFMVAVLLVLLAAGLAAGAVYFLLPLVT